MDEEKLKRLRSRFAVRSDRPEGEVLSPDLIGSTPTLLNAMQGTVDDDIDVALVGVPMDLGVTCRPGARFGPKAVREWQRVGPYNPGHRIRPMARLRCADVGDVPFRSQHELIASLQDIEAFYRRIAARRIRPLSVGGDHSMTFPILKALGHDEPPGLFHIDAHCDTEACSPDSEFHHGTPFRNAVLDGVLDPDRTIQIGIRGNALESAEFSFAAGMTVVTMQEFERRGVAGVLETARAVLGNAPFYVSVDIDGIDPAYAPGTGTPEIGGLTSREAVALLRGLAGMAIVGGDVVEVAPAYDPTSGTAQLGAGLLFEILSSMATP